MATLTKIEYIPNLSRGVHIIENSDSIMLEGRKAISYADLLTILTNAISPSTGAGTDTVIDCGDRMTGNEVHDMGNRV